MKLKASYLCLCIVGTILPYVHLMPFLREHGLSIRLLFEELFSTRIGAFFGTDVIVSSVVLWVFVLVEGRRVGVRHIWLPIVANLTVGVSLGLPLFLYMRQNHVEARE